MNRCVARQPDGSPCPEPGHHWDTYRGGLVCCFHRDQTEAFSILAETLERLAQRISDTWHESKGEDRFTLRALELERMAREAIREARRVWR